MCAQYFIPDWQPEYERSCGSMNPQDVTLNACGSPAQTSGACARVPPHMSAVYRVFFQAISQALTWRVCCRLGNGAVSSPIGSRGGRSCLWPHCGGDGWPNRHGKPRSDGWSRGGGWLRRGSGGWSGLLRSPQAVTDCSRSSVSPRGLFGGRSPWCFFLGVSPSFTRLCEKSTRVSSARVWQRTGRCAHKRCS